MAKIVDNHTRRRWKVSVARELGSLSEALLYYQVLHHHVHMGEFSKSNEEFSKEVNQSPRTFRRKIKSLIDKGIVSIEIGYNNIPIYKSVKKFDNSEESYKTYDLNHCLISKDNNAGVLLGHFIHKYTYWNEKEFFKTDKELMEELYMTSKELKRAKSILVKNKYISVRIGHARRCYYTVNMDHIENSINNLTSPAKTHRSALPKGTAQPYQNTPLSPAKTHRADKIDEPCQKGPRSPIKRDHQALPKGTTKPCQKGPYTVPVLKQELNNTCLFVCSSTTAREEIQPESSECEAIDLKTNKQENKIMKGEQPMSIEDPFPPKTQERPIEPFTMIGKWNDLIAPNNKILSLSVDRECELMKVLSEHFQGSVSKWDAYLQKVSDSSFLMGKIDPNFKINLGFILNPEKIRKILMGDYDDHVKGKAEYGHADNSEATSLVVTKGEYVKKILDSNDPAIIKKAIVTSLDFMSKAPNNVGLASYQSYLFRAEFSILQEENTKTLVIKSQYGAYTGLLPYHHLIALACLEFDQVLIFSGPNDQKGDYIYTGRREDTSDKIFDLWDTIMAQRASEALKTDVEIHPMHRRNDWLHESGALH